MNDHRRLDRAWSTKAPWAIEEVVRSERNMFRFMFQSKEDHKRIIDRGPWLVHKDVTFIMEWDPNVALQNISFNTTPIWVHIYGIPPAFMSKENIWKIGEKAGTVLEVEINDRQNGSQLRKLNSISM